MRKALTERPVADDAVGQDDLNSLVGYRMKRAFMRMYQDFRDSLLGQGLSQRSFSALSLIVENPDISQSALARTLGIERSGAVVIVDELEHRELIERHRVPEDRRAYALRATLAGQKAYENAMKTVRQHEDRMLANLDATERRQLLDLLARVQVGETE